MIRFNPERDPRGVPQVRCRCDECGADTIIRCAHITRDRERAKFSVDEGQAVIKLRANGWSFVKNTLRCPQCEKIRKEKNVSKEPTIVNIAPPAVAPLRQPTREQKRLIVAALDDAYDMAAQRYKGKETDKGIADMLADGVMPGWVAAVREDMFGPDGNEEMTDLSAEIKAWMKTVDDSLNMISEILDGIKGHKAEVKKYQDRLNRIITSIGPKAEKI